MQRDLIGYGANPPDPNWPGGARLALNFVLNYEEGSEPSVPDGDPASEWGLTENGMLNPGVTGRDLAAEGMFAYGSRVAFWRVMRLFAERNIPLTVFGCALALERHPPAAAAIRAAGHDICCHGWRWEKHYELSEPEERERIRRAVASLQQTMGERPLGWYCRYGPSLNTRNLLVEEGGFLYDSDAYDDELPYWVTVEGRPHLVIPYTLSTNDFEIRPRHLRDRRRLLHLLPRRFRLPVSRGRHPAAHAFHRPAYADHRPSRPRRRPGAAARSCEPVLRRLDHTSHRHRPPLGRHSSPSVMADPRRILVVKLGAFGNVVLSLGPFAAIRRHHAGAHITLLTTAPFADWLAQSPWFDTIWIDERPEWWDLSGWRRLRRRLIEARFDRAYDLQTSTRSNRYFHLFPHKNRPDWSGIAYGCALPDRDPNRNRTHDIDRQFGQLRQAGIDRREPVDLSWSHADLTPFALPDNLALLVPGSSPHRPVKRWPIERYRELAAMLTERGLIASGDRCRDRAGPRAAQSPARST